MAALLTYNGATLSSATVPAGRAVPIGVTVPADLLVATVGGREVGRAGGIGTQVDVVLCDLRGLAGRVGIRVSRVGRFTENIDKSFFAVPPVKPGPDNTGVRPGITLTPRSGFTANIDGAIYESLYITGPVRVSANGVTFRNCVLSHTSVLVNGPGRGTVFEDCEFDGQGLASNGLMLSAVTLRRVNIHHTCDGARLGSDTLVEDSWIHHLTRQGAWHPDCLQTTGGTGITIRRCVLDAYNPDNGDLNNAAVQIGGETATLIDFTIEDCWVDGGNYTINVGWGQPGHMVGPITLRSIEFGEHNRYGPLVHARAANIVAEGLTNSAGLPVVARFHD